MNTAASIANLSSNAIRLDCTPELIRAIWKAKNRDELETIYPPAADIDRDYFNPLNLRQIKREAVNKAAGFYGVEYLGRDRRTGDRVYYCNAGDTYAATLCFIGNRLIVSCWGYFVESGRVREQHT